MIPGAPFSNFPKKAIVYVGERALTREQIQGFFSTVDFRGSIGRVFTYPRLGHVGRLGNMLWEISATIAHARREGARAWIPADWEYRNLVSLPEEFYRTSRRGDWIIDAEQMACGPYHQSLDCIAEVQDAVKQWFSPSARGLERFHDVHGALLDRMDQGEKFCALHIRRGDYLLNQERFPPLTPRYWRGGLIEVHVREPDTTILVFSDDIPWCRANADLFGLAKLEFIEGHVRPIPVRRRTGEPADIFDLWLQTKCQSHIISNSTFSWWGAYLSDNNSVIYPDRWFGKSAVGSERMWEAFPASWRQIPC